MAGSQETDTLVFELEARELTLQTETHVGIRLAGDEAQVRRVQALRLNRRAQSIVARVSRICGRVDPLSRAPPPLDMRAVASVAVDRRGDRSQDDA